MMESGDESQAAATVVVATQQSINGAAVPSGYEIWADGVYVLSTKAVPLTPDMNEPLPQMYQRGRKKLTYRPLWVSGLGHTVDSDEPLLQLTFFELNGTPKSVWLGRGQVTDHRMLSQLGGAGLPVDSVNTQGVLIYLRAMEAQNGRTLPILRVGHRSGPYLIDNKLGWLIGKQWIGPGNLEADPRLNQKYSLAFTPHGDAEAWTAKWRELRNSGWVPRFLMGATFAPPLLRLLKCRTFIVHHWGDSSHGKCLDGSTLVPTGRGLQRIEDLDRPTYGMGFNDIPSNRQPSIWNGDQWVTATHFFKEQATRTLRVTTRRGYEVIATPEHPLWAQRGPRSVAEWVKSESLRVGEDAVRVAPVEFTKKKHNVQVDAFDPKLGFSVPAFEVDERVARLLGYLVADGTNTDERGLRLTSDIRVLEDALAICREVFGFDGTITAQPEHNTHELRVHGVALRTVLARCGLDYERAAGKRVPHVILRSPENVVRAFLRGYFECEGSFGRTCIEVTSASEQLLREVQVLLLGCDIASTRAPKKVQYDGEERTYWRVSIQSGESICAFAANIGVISTAREQQLGVALVTALDKRVARRSQLSAHPDFFDEVVSVEEAGPRMVYDLTIPEGHAFSANGIVSHNTATAVFALSAWGNPELLYSSLNRTAISLTEVFKHLTDLPVLYDEKQVATVTSEELIYSICTGSGRERGAKDGGLRQDRQQWLTIARTTGEVPLITNSDVGGQFNRVLQIHSKAFENRRDAESIYPFTAEHFGHGGPAFLRRLAELLQTQGGVDAIKQLCAELREALVNRIGVDSNHAQYGAVIATAQTLAESWLLNIPTVEAKERALDDATLALKETAPMKQLSYAEKALAKLRDHWASNPGVYYDDTTNESRAHSEKTVFRMVGVINDTWGVGYIPHEANDILIRAGYAPERVWRDFHNLGWLDTQTPDSPFNTLALRNGRSPAHHVYVIRSSIFFTGAARRPSLQLINGGGADNVVGLES